MSMAEVRYTIDLARKGYEPVAAGCVSFIAEGSAYRPDPWLCVRPLGSDVSHPGQTWDGKQYFIDNEEYHGYHYADADGNVFFLKPATGCDVVQVA